ncbi:shikimate dehydrogenase [Pelagibacterium sp. H642]|uniref:shikimate dehydrogenase n=1 Tax=Pelagibacterium sp. H642 TaxID=1881069 RepID=UPI002815DAF3|nr:shikimate dehydrogenase [Pelagibacterium sp. H642]WMT91493.1 shikimate dehydrogenase [Pelagibacterium sp. H642]
MSEDGMEKLTRGLADLINLGARGAIHIGLLGRGIGASLSPIMHRREGERLGLDYHYHLIDFDALGLGNDDLPEVIGILEQVGFTGLNVTHPFKQAVIAHLASLSEDAAAIGAVNTVLFRPEGRIGHNTDCWGFAESFRIGMPQVPRGRVLQVGAGGAGAAVAHALLELGVEDLAIFDLAAEKAQALAAQLARSGRSVHVVSDTETVLTGVDGVVNTTPIGMEKYPGLPVDADRLDARQWVADIIYFPRITALIETAREKGCLTLPGSGMAIFQAVKAFELFTGQKPSRDGMTETFEAAA